MASKNRFLRKKFRNVIVFTDKNLFQQNRPKAAIPGSGRALPVPNAKNYQEAIKKESEEH